MKIRLGETSYLKTAVDMFAEMTEDVVMLEFYSDYMKISGFNVENVCYSEFRLLKELFEEYKVKGEETVILKIADLKKVLSKLKNKDVLELEEKDNRIVLTLQGKNITEYKLSLFDESSIKKKDAKELPFDIIFEADSETLKDAIMDLQVKEKGSSFISFIIKDSILHLFTEETIMESKSSLDINILEKGEEFNEGLHSKFNSVYLNYSSKLSNLADKLKIKLGNEFPIEIVAEVENKFLGRIVIAPVMNIE